MTSSVMNDDLAVTLSSQSDRLPTEINKEWLKMMDKLGEGQFGEVNLNNNAFKEIYSIAKQINYGME